MSAFLSEYWWFLSLGVAIVVFGTIRLKQRTALLASMSARPVSFAATRAFSVSEMVRFHGTYRPGWYEILGYSWVVLFLAVGTFVVANALGVSQVVAAGAAVGAGVVGAIAARLESLSEIVIGPAVVARVSPVSWLSWSIPLSEVRQFDLVPGRPSKLRIIAASERRSVVLTRELYELLRASPAN